MLRSLLARLTTLQVVNPRPIAHVHEWWICRISDGFIRDVRIAFPACFDVSSGRALSVLDGIVDMMFRLPIRALQAVLCCLYQDHGAFDIGSLAGSIHSGGTELMVSNHA